MRWSYHSLLVHMDYVCENSVIPHLITAFCDVFNARNDLDASQRLARHPFCGVDSILLADGSTPPTQTYPQTAQAASALRRPDVRARGLRRVM